MSARSRSPASASSATRSFAQGCRSSTVIPGSRRRREPGTHMFVGSGSGLRHPGMTLERSVMKLFDLTGKVAIVTGSSRGIGRAIAELFAEAGAKVVISARNQGPCDEVVAGIKAKGGEAMTVTARISDQAQLENLVAKTREAWGRIDILVCNAAINPHYGSH